MRQLRSLRLPFLVAVCAATTACKTTTDWTAVDVTTPGWRLQQGQAVWRPPQADHDLAGELLVANHPDGRLLLEFSKPALPLVVVRLSPRAWSLQTPGRQAPIVGRGSPPPRSAWLVLPSCLRGEAPPPGWTFELGADSWRLARTDRRETLEGFWE